MKEFHVSDILTVTTGKVLSLRHMDGIYDILNFITSSDLTTLQLPGAMNACRPHLLQQFPQLESITGDEVTTENWKEWIETQEKELGSVFMVQPLSKGAFQPGNPFKELEELGREELTV